MTPESSPADVVRECAARLAGAEAARRPIEPLTDSFARLSVTDAYRVQQANVQRRLARGERIVGHKIGLTAKTMQELFGVSEPDYGHLLDTMLHDAREPLDLSALIDPQIEVEPAFVLGKQLKGPNVTVADVLQATNYVCVCFEVIDSRISGWRIKLQDTVADNGSSARVVLGATRKHPLELELDNLQTDLELDGRVVQTGNTGAILDHPANGVAWLANHLARFDLVLEPGHIVLPGTCVRSVRIGGHHEAVGRIAGLGAVSLRLAGAPSIPNPAHGS